MATTNYADELDSAESDNEEEPDEIVFSPDFIATTGVREYQAACKRLGIIPVQQFIATIDQESLSLKHRGVGAMGGVAVFECVRVNKCIRALDVEDNQLGLGVDADAGGLAHISRALTENAVITMLDLSANNLSGRGCAALATALGANATIVDLSLRGNNMGDLGAIALARALAGNKTLTKLDISSNAVDESGAVALANLVGGLEQLRILDLSWNSIRLSGAEALMDALRNSKLVRLNAAYNGLAERGAKSLAGALAENRELQFLDVSQNNLREEAARHLAEALRVNTSLRSLQLNGNPIGDRGLGILLQAIGTHCTVRDLGASNVGVVKSGVGLFDPLNPTGRFSLDLAQPFDRSIFEAHRHLDRQDEASGIDNFLSVAYNGRALELGEGEGIQDWPLPDSGTLAYDYISGKRVPREARAQREVVFESFLHDLASNFVADFERLVHLRAACVAHYFSCAQAAQILALFTYTQRCDALAVLFRRIVDSQNFAHTVWRLISPGERLEARARFSQALEPFLPESEKVKFFLTEMERETEEATDPLATELAKAWASILPRVRSSLADALADAPDSAVGTDADALATSLRGHFSARYVAIRSVFRFYASEEEREALAARGEEDSAVPFDVFALKLSGRELWAMCKACELTSDALPLAAIDRLFHDGTAIQADTTLNFGQWLLGLVRLAIAHSELAPEQADETPAAVQAEPAADADDGDAADEAQPTGLAGALETLLVDKVLRHGERADADAFRREFWSKAVQKQLHPFWFPLKIVFDKWKRVDASEGASQASMSLAEFCTLLKTRQLVDYSELPDALKTAEAVNCFNLARAATDHSKVDGPRVHDAPVQHLGESGELIFFEFFEAIGRCALIHSDADGATRAQMGMADRVARFAARLMGAEGTASAVVPGPEQRQSQKPKPSELEEQPSAPNGALSRRPSRMVR